MPMTTSSSTRENARWERFFISLLELLGAHDAEEVGPQGGGGIGLIEGLGVRIQVALDQEGTAELTGDLIPLGAEGAVAAIARFLQRLDADMDAVGVGAGGETRVEVGVGTLAAV